MRDEFVVLMRPGHPAAAALDLDAYLAAAASPGLAGGEPGGRGRPRAGGARAQPELAAVVSHHLVVAPILAAQRPRLHAGRAVSPAPVAAAFGLALRPLPAGLELPSQPTSLVFHNRYAQRPAHRWLRALVAETARIRS